MRIILTGIATLDHIAELLGRFASLFAPLMLLVTCYVVITRYVFNSGSVAVQDLITYFNAMLFTLGAGYTLKHNAHVRVDIFYGPATARTKAWVNLLGYFFLLLPVTIFLLWSCWTYVVNSWEIHEGSADTGGLPYVYLLKSLILVMAATLFTQGIAEGLRSLLQLLEYNPDADLANLPSQDGDGSGPFTKKEDKLF
jgi:TRAP-type mannitol/chloroaromatic compound transport system permease small subunit